MTRQDTDTFVPPPATRPFKAERQFQRRALSWQKRQSRLVKRHPPRKSRPGEAGTARGQCIRLGSVDAGWIMPPPVTVGDGTQVQLFKVGHGLTASLEAI